LSAAQPDAGGAVTKASMARPVFYNVGVSTEPGEVKPAQPVKLTFGIQDVAGRAIDGNGLEVI
jgi:hypothetical protein